MPFTILDEQPELRSPDVAYDDAAPGLYDDGEVLVDLDGDKVAVSVDTEWLPNGSGVAFTGYARWTHDCGTSKLCPKGKHIECTFSYTADPHTVNEFGVDAIAKDILLIVMGEEPILVRSYEQEDGTTGTMPVIGLDPTVKLNASMRQHINNLKSVTGLKKASSLLS
jgi:hypothetical protein